MKALILCPDGIHATLHQVADYFEVSYSAIKHIVDRNAEELVNNGYRSEIYGADLLPILGSNGEKSQVKRGRKPSKFLVRRTILNVALGGALLAVAEWPTPAIPGVGAESLPLRRNCYKRRCRR